MIYHDLHPHPALSITPNPDDSPAVSENQKQEAEYRQLLVQGVLAVLLPTEDLENACLRTLVADVIAESILGNAIGGKVCEGWFIWESMTKLAHVIKAKIEPKATGEPIENDTRSRLEKFGLLADKKKEEKLSRPVPRHYGFASMFWRLLQFGYLTIVSIRFVILGLINAHSQPPRPPTVSSSIQLASESSATDQTVEPLLQTPRPILDYRIFPLISDLLDLSSRMPWLHGAVELIQQQVMHSPLTIGTSNGTLDQ